MLTEYEALILHEDIRRESQAARRRQLMPIRDEPMWRIAAAFKCALLVSIVASLVVMGVTVELQTQTAADFASGSFAQPREVTAAKATTLPEVPAAVGADYHLKAVFDEHRHALAAHARYNATKVAARMENP